jgi:hypothetical protein
MKLKMLKSAVAAITAISFLNAFPLPALGQSIPTYGGTGGQIRILSGTGSFASVSDANDILNVSPGATLNGAVNLQALNLGPSGAVAPLIYTPSWGNDSSSWGLINGWIPTGQSDQQAQVSLVAPTSPGVYHIIFAVGWELSGDQVASATDWPLGYDVWNDGNDIAEFNASQISSAQLNGWAFNNFLNSSGYYLRPIPTDAITLIVGIPAPTVTTGAASSITANSATLNGSVNPNGSATAAVFQWGTTTSYGNTVPNPALSCGSGNNTIGVSVQSLSGLAPNTIYHYQLVASSSAGTVYGGDQTFTTGKTPPTITSVSPSPLQAPTQGGQTLTGTFVIRGQNFQGGFVTTDGPLLLTGSAQVSADGTSIEQNYQIGCCAPYQGEIFHLTVNTSSGTATTQDSITLSSQSLSGVSGKILSSLGQGIGGASVQIGTATTTSAGDGSYAITGLSAGNYPVVVSATGYTTYSSTLSVSTSAQSSQTFILNPVPASGSLPTVTVSTKYNPDGQTVIYFLNGVTFPVTFNANVDWGTNSPGFVKFITPNNGTYQVNANGGNIASQPIDVGHAFGAGGKLQVQAVSSDGSQSVATVANFAVMPNTLASNPNNFSVVDEGSEYYYQYLATPFPFIDTDISTSIPDDVPIFGGDSGGLQWTPTVNGKVNGGAASFTSGGLGFNASFNLAPIDPAADGLAISAGVSPQSGLNIFENYNLSSEQWKLSGAGETLIGNVGLSYTVPIPIPPEITNFVSLNATVGVNVEFNGTLNVVNLNPVALSGDLDITNVVSGTLGANVASVVTAEVSISGGAYFEFQYPQMPTLQSYGLLLSLDASSYALGYTLFDFSTNWTWSSQNSSPQVLSLVTGLNQFKVAAVPIPHPYPRNYLSRPSYAAFHSQQISTPSIRPLDLTPPPTTQNPSLYALQTDVLPFSESSIAASGTNCYAVWLYDDPNRSANNRTVLVFSKYDGTEWTDPTPVADDGTADFHPQIKEFSDGSAVVAWENEGSALSTNADFNAMVTNLEIATAFYDPVAGQWQPMQQITTNSYLDRSPRIAGVAENNLMLVWVANTNNDLEGSDINTNQFWFTTWNGSAWSTPQIFVSVPYPLLKYDMTYDGTNAYVVMSLDSDNALTNANAHELYEVAYQNGSWGGLQQLTSDSVPDDNPQMAIDPNGHVVLTWLKGGEVSSVGDFNFANRQVISTNQYSSNLGDFKLASGSDGRLAILWAKPSPQYPSDLYALFYDPNFELWGSPKQLTADPETELETAATFYSTNQLIALYDRLDISTNDMGGTFITNADLYILQYQLTNDLALVANSLTVSPANPAPGDTVTLSVTAENLSDSAVSNVLVAFYQGDPNAGGMEIGETNLTGVLAAGATMSVSIPWTVPATTNALTIYAVVDPDQEFSDSDLLNNEVTNTFVAPDLAVQSVTWSQITSNLFSVTATVINQGTIASQPGTVSFMLNSPTGTTLFSTNIVSLAPGQSIDVNFIWTVPSLGNGLTLFAVVNGGTNAPDLNSQNNVMQATIQPNISMVNVLLGPVTLLPGGVLQVSMTGLAGQTYLIQASTDLVNWTTLTTLTLTNGTGQFTDPATASYPQRFYRAVVFSQVQPQMGSLQLFSGSVVQVTVKGLPGQPYIIEASTNLVNWVTLTNVVLPTSVWQFIDTSTNFNQRFYRAKLP